MLQKHIHQKAWRSTYSIKILATTGEIQDLMGAHKSNYKAYF